MLQRGIKPESLPPDEDVQKVERHVKSEAKQVAKGEAAWGEGRVEEVLDHLSS